MHDPSHAGISVHLLQPLTCPRTGREGFRFTRLSRPNPCTELVLARDSQLPTILSLTCPHPGREGFASGGCPDRAHALNCCQ